MAQTVANLADVMKEVWTSDRLEKQFYDEQRFLKRLERTSKFTHGKKAVVPIHKGRAGSASVFGSAGGTLNAAAEQRVDRAEYTVPYNYHQTEIQLAAINEAAGGGFSVGSALELEVSGALADIRNLVTRQVLTNGDAHIAGVTDTASSNTLTLTTTGTAVTHGYDAIVNGWLVPGQTINVGTAADDDSLFAGRTITAVGESESAPTVTFSGAAADPAGTEFISLTGARVNNTVVNESTGLRTIAASNTSSVGGLDPDNAGEEFWKPAHVDTTTTVLSLDLLLTMQRKIHRKTGSDKTYVLASLKQRANLYSLLQSQVRFDRDSATNAGSSNPSWNGMELDALPEVPDREVYMLNLNDLALVTGAKFKKPTWISDMQGANTGMVWSVGTTAFKDALCYPVGLAVKRRNGTAAAIALSA